MFKSEKAALRVVQEDASRRSNFDCLRIADKKDDPQFIFQRFDHAADGGLGNMKIPRRFAETFLFRYFHEILHMTIVHNTRSLLLKYFLKNVHLVILVQKSYFLYNEHRFHNFLLKNYV